MMYFLRKLILVVCVIAIPLFANAEEVYEDYADDTVVEESAAATIEASDAEAAEAINNYDVSGSLFEKITSLEQEKILMQLEKERVQLDLELDRLNAEKIKIQMELETLSGRTEQQKKELEVAKAELETQAKQLSQQKEQMENGDMETMNNEQPVQKKTTVSNGPISQRYKLVNIVGVGDQLQATLEDLSSGQNKRIAVGRTIDEYTVKSISLDEGIVFEKDGETETLNIGR